MAADGSVDRWRRFFACRIHPQAGLRWDSLPSAGCLAALAVCPHLAASALFRRSGRYGHRNLAQAPEHVGSNQQAGGALRFRFRCIPSTPLSPVK